MKKILGTLATVLAAIETIILDPISAVMILVCRFVLHWDRMKICDVYANYRWAMMGWWLKMNCLSKEHLRFSIYTTMS